MSNAEIAQICLSIFALFCGGIYAQAGKFGTINGIDFFIGGLQIFIAIGAVALMAMTIHWWTIAVTPISLFAAGPAARSLLRTGVDVLLLSKSWTGPLMVLAVCIGWLVYFTN